MVILIKYVRIDAVKTTMAGVNGKESEIYFHSAL